MSKIDISRPHNRTRIVKGREPFTADLDLLDRRLEAFRRESVRDPSDPPFNEEVWSKFRETLAVARGHGYQEPDEENTCMVCTSAQVVAMGQVVSTFEHLIPVLPREFANKNNLPLDVVLTEFNYATTAGLMEMVWSAECSRCAGGTKEVTSLHDLTKTQTCGLCGNQNVTDTLDQVKIFFLIDPEVMYFPVTGWECPHSPSSPRMPSFRYFMYGIPTTNNTKYSYLFGYGEQDKSHPALTKGLYRLHCPFSRVECFVDVKRDAVENDEPLRLLLKTSEIKQPATGAVRKSFTLEHGKVRFDLLCDMESLMALWVYKDLEEDDHTKYYVPVEERKPYASAADCLHVPSFQRLFGDQVVSKSSRFGIKKVVLVFTDVVSSTDLYESSGDGAALQVIQDHFEILFGAMASRGRIVKTVGDAVMGAFSSGEAAILAMAEALESIHKVKRPSGNSLQIRVGIHAGSAVVVPLNGINDYFGSTVNIAARIEGKANGGECLVTKDVLKESAATAAFEKLLESGSFQQTRETELTLKGVPAPFGVCGFQSKHTV